jgi:hypothetical protein
MDDEEVKDDAELSDEHLDGILDEELDEDEETEEETTDEFGNPKEEEKGWE